MQILDNIGLLATCKPAGGQRAIHEIRNAALVWQHEHILWVGPASDLPDSFTDGERFDAGRKLVVPGLVDCHTHLAFGGWRAREFVQRCTGVSYEEIARAGGGIRSTVRQTREMAEEELFARSVDFLREMIRLGITTIEAKSGYGLDLETELKQLRVYRRLAREMDVEIASTFLGAHTAPPEYSGRQSDYVRFLVDEALPRVASERLAEFCDVFVEGAAFSPDEARFILSAAGKHGLAPKVHADQLSDTGGAMLSAEVGAASADHLEYASKEGIAAMAKAGVVAVNLPLASVYLQRPAMPARRFIEAGAPVAVATDFNPGSAPSYHLPLAMTLACITSGMTPAEALKGATLYGARAIRRDHLLGSLEPGKRADFLIVDSSDVEQWLYHFRPNTVNRVFIKGRDRTHG